MLIWALIEVLIEVLITALITALIGAVWTVKRPSATLRSATSVWSPPMCQRRFGRTSKPVA